MGGTVWFIKFARRTHSVRDCYYGGGPPPLASTGIGTCTTEEGDEGTKLQMHSEIYLFCVCNCANAGLVTCKDRMRNLNMCQVWTLLNSSCSFMMLHVLLFMTLDLSINIAWINLFFLMIKFIFFLLKEWE